MVSIVTNFSMNLEDKRVIDGIQKLADLEKKSKSKKIMEVLEAHCIEKGLFS